ncbi:CatB-related O-acetyltransferase [Mucilaginibacter sp. L196]|uniref:CatB-related O-acetyltransferase n=1 Tax=Mucilaginibacter sp. L196 TaxID=1641870 RepID=UPI0020B12F42|nr:CatB-related O-acetyltransferase [Mucilaginibacter sp. L196]
MNYKTFFKGIKSIYNDLLIKERLNKFNIISNNNIKSDQVSLTSIIGHDVTAMEGVYICDRSTIDSYTFIGFNALISKCTIGRYNSIASNVNIGHGEHSLYTISTNTNFITNAHDFLTNAPCIIEHDVWIGVGSIIRRGVTIGVGAVIGANSFVNKDVPPYAIVAGSPARIIKYRFSPEKIAMILASQWWNLELDEAKGIIEELELNTNGY